MAKLVSALRATAARLDAGSVYRWSHFGMCNCGHLAQTVTRLSPQEIQRAAFVQGGDWGLIARDYCPTSGLPLDDIVAALLELGLDRDDIVHLERLSDPRVTARVGRALRHWERADVVDYLRAWADLLDDAVPVPAVRAA